MRSNHDACRTLSVSDGSRADCRNPVLPKPPVFGADQAGIFLALRLVDFSHHEFNAFADILIEGRENFKKGGKASFGL